MTVIVTAHTESQLQSLNAIASFLPILLPTLDHSVCQSDVSRLKMSKSLLMKLFTVTIIPLIIAPVLTCAAPNPSKTITIAPSPTPGGTSAATPVIDFTKLPNYAPNLESIQETMHLYSLALDGNNLTQLDVLFTPNALVTADSWTTTLTLPDAKGAIQSARTDWLCSTKHTFVIDTVQGYYEGDTKDPARFQTVGHWTLMKSLITPDNHKYNVTFYSNFKDTFDFPPPNSPGDKRWQFSTRNFNNGYW